MHTEEQAEYFLNGAIHALIGYKIAMRADVELHFADALASGEYLLNEDIPYWTIGDIDDSIDVFVNALREAGVEGLLSADKDDSSD